MLAYADRELYLGDSDFVHRAGQGADRPGLSAPPLALISPMADDGATIDARRPFPAHRRAQPLAFARLPARKSQGTTHFVAIDGWGDIATS
jgi:gamma-glutamyltranspeptidase/glutathione hydrolase